MRVVQLLFCLPSQPVPTFDYWKLRHLWSEVLPVSEGTTGQLLVANPQDVL